MEPRDEAFARAAAQLDAARLTAGFEGSPASCAAAHYRPGGCCRRRGSCRGPRVAAEERLDRDGVRLLHLGGGQQRVAVTAAEHIEHEVAQLGRLEALRYELHDRVVRRLLEKLLRLRRLGPTFLAVLRLEAVRFRPLLRTHLRGARRWLGRLELVRGGDQRGHDRVVVLAISIARAELLASLYDLLKLLRVRRAQLLHLVCERMHPHVRLARRPCRLDQQRERVCDRPLL
mmetsp:Transcript_2520/g.6803  ORF Transcript_2520/g.6803 Transcript_2520/m.6803 type:complete len:231 (+) Transcript_2520:99-791(+)